MIEISNNGPDRTSSSSFTVNIKSSATNFSTSTNNALWSPGFAPFANINFGQELAGTSGALAYNVFFVGNSWMDSSGIWRVQTADAADAIDSPPYGGWLQTPCDTAQTNEPQGGVFFTECCTPP